MKDYKTIFDGIEAGLINYGTRNLPEDRIRAELDKFKYGIERPFTDNEYFEIIIGVVFYAGFKAATVDSRLSVIRSHFPDFRTVAKYQKDDIAAIMADTNMIRNERKIRACVENARVFAAIVDDSGSFRNYIDSFSPTKSFENLMLLKEEIEYRFRGIGKITTYHILTDIGLPVLKPDRVMCRIFQRLGLIENDDQLLKTVIQGRKFAEATGSQIRYIDIVFVAYGQAKTNALGLDRGICLEENPLCSVCKVTGYCNYFKAREGRDRIVTKIEADRERRLAKQVTVSEQGIETPGINLSSIPVIIKEICEELGKEGKIISRKDILSKAKQRGIKTSSVLPADYCDNAKTGKWSPHSFLHSIGPGNYVLCRYAGKGNLD